MCLLLVSYYSLLKHKKGEALFFFSEKEVCLEIDEVILFCGEKMKPYPSPGTIILTPPPPPPADPAPAFTDGTRHAVRSSNVKEAELDDDAVAKAIIAIVDLLPKLGSGKEVEQGRIGSALSKKERVVSLSLLTLFVCTEALCQALYFRKDFCFVLYF